MPLQRLKAGDDFSVSARTWDAFADAAEYHQQHKDRLTNAVVSRKEKPASSVMIRAPQDLLPGDAVQLGGPLITPSTNLPEFKARAGFDAALPAANAYGNIAIAAEAIPSGELGLAYVDGYAPAQVQYPHGITWLDRCDLKAGSTVLSARPEGTARIVWSEAVPANGGTVWATVALNERQNTVLRATSTTNISPGSSAAVLIADTEDTPGGYGGYEVTAHLDWMHGGQAISANKQLLIEWFPMETKWRITGAECED